MSKSKDLNQYSEHQNIARIGQKSVVWCFVKQDYFLGHLADQVTTVEKRGKPRHDSNRIMTNCILHKSSIKRSWTSTGIMITVICSTRPPHSSPFL